MARPVPGTSGGKDWAMITYPQQKFESIKSEVEQRYRILDGSSAYDTNHMARTVALAFRVPMVIAALNERYRAWFSSSHGVSEALDDQVHDLCSLANLADRFFQVEDMAEDQYFSGEKLVSEAPNMRFFAGVPLRDPDGKRFGTLCILDNKPRVMSESDSRLLKSFAGLLSNDICVRSAGRYAVQDLIHAEEDKCSLYDLAVTDSLTGALNRRAFFHLTEREVPRAERHRVPLTAVLFDIDHFKKVNDVHGHAAGDDVIASLSRIVSKEIREEDYLGRLGGEEFGLILPETTPSQAVSLTNRLRQKIKGLTFLGEGGSFSITVSFGVAAIDPGERSVHPALERADRALYVAKRNGRDRVELAVECLGRLSA
ncbi:sensor domain-containing diguanylate cyclase [Parvularcula marina]|uniref:diguanylate cyclase n=2 Tax=Parvularcula marina TaxID=2292771 RepID=A0A371RF49_9PROT|nr:sensor domain-containing diguanylate cyclase [Parvularcula marina]